MKLRVRSCRFLAIALIIMVVLGGCVSLAPAPMPSDTPAAPAAPPTDTPLPPTDTPPPPAKTDLAALHLGWTWPDGDLQAEAAAIGADGVLYVMDSGGTLRALDAAGRELWQYKGDYDRAVGPWLSRDTQVLYIVTDQLALVAVGSDGAARWSRKLPEDARTLSVAPDGTALVTTAEDGRRIAPDGQQEAPFTWPSPLFPAVAFDGRGRSYLLAKNEIWVLSSAGEQERACPADVTVFSETIVGLPDDGAVYTDLDYNLVAVNSACQELWRYAPEGPEPDSGRGWGALVFAEDGSLFAARNNGEIHALDAAGQLRWRLTPDPKLGTFLAPGPDGTLLAAGSAGELAAFDGEGQQIWSYAPYNAGETGALAWLGEAGLATIQAGRLLFFTTDPAVMLQEPTPVPPPASVEAAEAEIVAWLLDEAGCQGEAIAIWGPVEEGEYGMGGVNTDAARRVWWCEDGQWIEQADMQAAITRAETRNKEAGYDVRQYPVAYYEFGIMSIADDRQEAVVYMGSTIGPLWGSGYEYTLRRRPNGEWTIVESKMLWVS